MSNEHIGRLQKIGFGKESTPGTPVSATDWVPKVRGVFTPEVTKAKDLSAYGNIDSLRDSQTVKNLTKVSLEAIARDVFIGDFLLMTFGTTYACLEMAIAGLSGTFEVGETVTGTTSSATGVVRRVEDTSQRLYVDVVSGTFTTGAGETLTGGTSGATGTGTYDTGTLAHLFLRLNDNNHPSYTFYGKDDVGDFRAAYCMMDTFELTVAVEDYVRFTADLMGQQESSTSSTPSFASEENVFLASHVNVYFAADLDSLDAATATALESVKLRVNKNLEDYQAMGSTDVESLHNKNFTVSGDMSGLFNALTLKNYVLNSTKRAMRIEIINTDVTIGTAENPTLRFDIAQASFENWGRGDDNDALVRQTLGFEGEFSVGDSETVMAVLKNEQATDY